MPQGDRLKALTGLMGDFNYTNIAGAAAMALTLGVSREDVVRGIAGFQGVRRRQELLFQKGNITVYEDFAHHPTAVGAMLREIRQR